MISVIICSINSRFCQQLKNNIAETIGVPYEVIAIDNRESNNGICKVYNIGASRASYPVLCFVHEDVLFKTDKWGQLVVKHLSDEKVGLIGVAGGDSKSLVPSTWSTSFQSNEINIIQHTKSNISKHVAVSANEVRENSKRVVALDGVFLCTRKDVFEQFQFDEKTLNGFHGYDVDYSLQVFTKYEVRVVPDILIQHFSEGSHSRDWLNSTIIVQKKWKHSLPLSVLQLSKAEWNFYHWKSLQVFLEQLSRLNYSFPEIVFYYLHFSFCRYFKMRRFLSMGKYVLTMSFDKLLYSPRKRKDVELKRAA